MNVLYKCEWSENLGMRTGGGFGGLAMIRLWDAASHRDSS